MLRILVGGRVVVSVLSLLAALQPLPATAQDGQPSCTELPPSIEVNEFLRPAVSTLLAKSGTFRRQCQVIASTRRVRIVLTAVGIPRESTAPRARATFGRYSYGLLRVVIEMPMVADHHELIPHEFEHVLEQIEGLDLAALARDGTDGVMQVADGAFETRRAQTAGRTAADEVRGEEIDPAVTGAIRGLGRVWRGLSSRAARTTSQVRVPQR